MFDDIDDFSISESQKCTPEECNKILNTYKHSSINIITQNIRSINHNYSNFLTLMERIKLNLDIIVLTECWLSCCPAIPNMIGYECHSTKHIHNQNDGVVFYAKRDLNGLIEEPYIPNANCLILKLNNDVAIVGIYRSPSTNDIDEFCDHLNAILNGLSGFRNVMVIGDINIDIIINSNNTSQYLDILAYHGLLSAHHIPTRLYSCLDHVMLKTRYHAKTMILSSSITDHEAVLLNLKYKHKRILNTHIKHITNYDKLTKTINELDFTRIYSNKNANEATNLFVNILHNAINSNTEKRKINKKNILLKPWMTPGLLRCIKHRDKLHINMKASPNNHTYRFIYTRYRNFCNKLLKKLKREYDRKELIEAGTNSKKIWKTIKSIANLDTQRDKSIRLLSLSDEPIVSLNKTNHFFANVGKELAANLINQNSPRPFSSSLPNVNMPNSFVMYDTDVEEVYKIIMSLKNDCSVGWDGISSNIIKRYRDVLVEPISYICNLSLSTGVFPKAFKKSVIRPIYKGGDGSNVTNYRPISILTTLSKILERVINKRLYEYIERYKLLADQQYGFRIGRSTEDAVLDLSTYILNNLDNGSKCLAIFLDLAKAFDTVSIPLLLWKLEQIGIRGHQLKIINDFLTDREQCVKIDNFHSEYLQVNYGIPQGSILGPTLFLIYINDLCRLSIEQGKIISFADDTVLLFQAKTWKEVFELAQKGFNKTYTWLRENILTLNHTKTNYMCFSIRNNTQPDNSFKIVMHSCLLHHVSCSCTPLVKTSTTRYLGVHIDQNMKFDNHIDLLTKRIRKIMYVFRNLRGLTEPKLSKIIYYALCQSIIFYCITVWGGVNNNTILPLERAVRGVLKVQYNQPIRYPTEKLYIECNVLSVRKLYILSVVLKKHASLQYNPTITLSRNPHIFPYDKKIRTSFFQKHYPFLSTYLYNIINKKHNLYSMNKSNCKRRLKQLLNNCTYEETESMLKVVS